jgi:hypothetical protein
MNEITATNSKDKLLHALRWAAFGAVGLYLWRANKVEGKALGAQNPNNFKLEIDTERALNAAFELVPPLRKLNPMIKTGIQEFVKGFKKERK